MNDELLHKLLGPLEKEVMEAAWLVPAATVKEIHATLSSRRRIAYTTVLTVMIRLSQKGLLKHKRVGNAYQFRAAMTAEEFVRAASEREAQRLVRDFGALAVSPFLEAVARVDPRLLQALERLASKARREQRGKTP